MKKHKEEEGRGKVTNHNNTTIIGSMGFDIDRFGGRGSRQCVVLRSMQGPIIDSCNCHGVAKSFSRCVLVIGDFVCRLQTQLQLWRVLVGPSSVEQWK